jgi:hypothetical protein
MPMVISALGCLRGTSAMEVMRRIFHGKQSLRSGRLAHTISRYLSCGEQFGYGRYPVLKTKFQNKSSDSGIDGSVVDNSEGLRDQDGP